MATLRKVKLEPIESDKIEINNNLTDLEVETLFINLLVTKSNGINNMELDKILAYVSIIQRKNVINNLLSKNKISLLYDSNNNLIYKLISEEDILKFKDLNSEDLLIYQLIERENNKGLWLRNIRQRSGFEQTKINKILKTLTLRKLVKCESSVEGKNKKVYMLYDLIPAREITGGVFHSGHDLDIEFINILSKAIVSYLKKYLISTSSELLNYIKSIGLSKIQLAVEDITVVLNTLLYDSIIEVVPANKIPLLLEKKSTIMDKPCPSSNDTFYRYAALSSINSDPYASIPCAICPVAADCGTNSKVNPRECVYFTKWLQL